MGAFDDMLLKVGIDPKGFLDGVEKISAAVKTMKGSVVASAEAAEEAQTDANDEVAKSWRGLVVVINAANKQVVKSHGEAAKAAKDSSLSVEKLIRSTLLLYGALVGSRSLLDFAKNLVTTDAAVGRLSHSLNTTPERISALAMASQRMGGSFQGTLGALRSFSDAFEALKFDGDPSMLDPLSKLSARTGKAIDVGQDFHATLLQVADALQALDKVNPQDADYLGRKITGDADLTNLLKRGRAAVEAEEAKSRKLGAISAADAAAAERAQETWNAASQAATGVGRTLETLVLPIVTDFFNRLAKLVEDHQADIQRFAGNVRDAGLALADWLSKVDWDGLKRDLQEAWDKFDSLSRTLTGQGGLTTAMELFGTVVAASVVAPLLSIIATLTRLAAIPIPGVLSMFANPAGLTVAAATVGGLADAEMARRTGKAMTSGDPNAKFDPETGFVNDLDFGYGANKPAGGSNPKTGVVAWIKGLLGIGGGTGSMDDRRVRDAIITTAENTKKLVEKTDEPGGMESATGGGGGGSHGGAPSIRYGRQHSSRSGSAPVAPYHLTGNEAAQMADGIRLAAKHLGIKPEDLGTVISYETGGTMDKWKAGPRTKWGQHRGLIQWGEPQARQYRVTKDSTIGEQMAAVEKYLRDTGVKPGMGILDIYSAINAGGVGKYNASDRPGMTVRSHVEGMTHSAHAGALARLDAMAKGGLPTDATSPVAPAPSGASSPTDGVGDAAALAAHDRIVAGKAHPGDRDLIEAHRRQQNAPTGATLAPKPSAVAGKPATPKHRPEKGVRTVAIPETSPSERHPDDDRASRARASDVSYSVRGYQSTLQGARGGGTNTLNDLERSGALDAAHKKLAAAMAKPPLDIAHQKLADAMKGTASLPKTLGDFTHAMARATVAIRAHERAQHAVERHRLDNLRSHPAMRLHEDLRRSLAGSQHVHHTTNIDRSSETTINGGLHVKTAATDARGIAADLAPHLRRQQDVGRGQYGVV